MNHNATPTGRFSGWSDWTDIPNSDAATTSHTFSGLAFDRVYRYQLRAVDAVGPSAAAPSAAPWHASVAMPGPGDPKPTQHFDTLKAAGNRKPTGLWSDGTTMWVADDAADKIYAYMMSNKSRDAAKHFNTVRATGSYPRGIWSDGITMWVADPDPDELNAYQMSDKSRVPAKDFITLSFAGTTNPVIVPGNRNPYGIWSDGTTMWVVDESDNRIYAYYAYPELRASSVAASSATLTLTGHSGDWWIQQTSPTAGPCKPGESDYSHTLTGLSSGTEHTYKAYAGSSCEDYDEIAVATFTTAP